MGLKHPHQTVNPICSSSGHVALANIKLNNNFRPAATRCLMGYIVDLLMVMQGVFWIKRHQVGNKDVSRRDLNRALEAYGTSTHKKEIHTEIRAWVAGTGRLRADSVVSKITELVNAHRFKPEALLERGLVVEHDEEWISLDRMVILSER